MKLKPPLHELLSRLLISERSSLKTRNNAEREPR